ncbi:hypothetical protein HDV01_005244 [Terramyces sp. JEL0728]|nr:hypothetical protein HDV01_005244 [Terramyces sp. JEL0728]
MNSIISTLKSGSQDEKFEAIRNSIHYTDIPDRFAKELLPLILSQIQDPNSSDRVKLSILDTIPHVTDCALNCSPEYQFPVLASCIEAIVVLIEQVQLIKNAIVAYANMYPVALNILARQPGQPTYWAIINKLNVTIDSLYDAPNMGLRASAAYFLRQMIDDSIPQIEQSHARIAHILGEMGYARDVMIKQSREKRILDREELEYEFKKTKVEPEPATSRSIAPSEITPLIPNIPLDFLIPIIIQTIADTDEIEAENENMEDAVEIDIDQILNQTKELTDEEKQDIVQDCLGRVLQMDSYFQKVDKSAMVKNDTNVAGRFGWLLVSARLMTRSNSNEKVKEYVLDFIGNNLSARIELALYWLFEEYLNGNEYQIWLGKFLELLENENQEERLFTKFLVELPEMTDLAISKVLEFCNNDEKKQLGITTLRDLIQNRPSSRNVCLEHLLSFTTLADNESRKIAVESLKVFIPSNESLTTKIINFAQENLRKLSEKQESIPSYLDLFLGCCSSKPALLKEYIFLNTSLFEFYPSFDSKVAPVVLDSCGGLFDSLHGEVDTLLELIETYPSGAESLLLVLIKSLLRNENLKDKAIEIAKKVYLEKDLDFSFLLLIINYFDKPTVLNQLFKLVESLDDSDEQKNLVKDVFVSLVELKDDQQLITPNELLIKLHLLENVTVKKQCKATVKIVTRKTDSQKFAVKIINKKKMKGEEEAVKQEIDILSKIRNPHIISLVDLCTDKDHYYLVMDLATGGELFDRILSKGSYGEKDAAKIVSQILSALNYLHDMDIVHRDLKPENLLFRTDAEDAELLLADFGLSRVVHQNEFLKTSCGTPHYVAPEILKESGHGKPVDMWSVGVISYVLLCGYTPFWGGETNSVPVLYNAIVNGKYEFDEENWSFISKEAKDFISKLLLVNPTKRMSVKEALVHPWLATENNTDILQNVRKNFSAKTTLRKAVNAVRLINRMRSLSTSQKELA